MAGKSVERVRRTSGVGDHPRMCEEKRLLQHGGFQRLGSPPHVRGKDPVLHLRQCLQVRPDHARHLVHLSFLRA